EHGAASANLLAVEERLLAFDRLDDVENADLRRRPSQKIAAPDSLRSVDDPRLLELREDLREEGRRYALQIGEVPAARRLRERPDEPQQAMEPVLHAASEMRHNADYICPCYEMQAPDARATFATRALNSAPPDEMGAHDRSNHWTPAPLDRPQRRHPRGLARQRADPGVEVRRGPGAHRRISDQSLGSGTDVRRRRSDHGASLRHSRCSGRHGEPPARGLSGNRRA